MKKALKFLPFALPLPILAIILIFVFSVWNDNHEETRHITYHYEYDVDHHKQELKELKKHLKEMEREKRKLSRERKSFNFSYNDIDEVEVNGKSVMVNIDASDTDEVSFTGENMRKNCSYSVFHEKTGNRLKIWVKKSGRSYNSGDAVLHLNVPHNIKLTVYNTSGNVHVSDLNGSKVNLKTTSGDIIAEDVNGKISAKSASGNVVLNDTNGNIDVQTASGSQHLRDVSGKMVTVSASGEIFLDDTNGKFNIVTASGDIRGNEVRLSESSSFTSVSGNINVDLDNELDEVSFDLKSLSGGLYVGRKHKQKRLELDNGSILVKGKSVSGSQNFK